MELNGSEQSKTGFGPQNRFWSAQNRFWAPSLRFSGSSARRSAALLGRAQRWDCCGTRSNAHLVRKSGFAPARCSTHVAHIPEEKGSVVRRWRFAGGYVDASLMCIEGLYVVKESSARLGASTTTALSAQLSRAMCKALSPPTEGGTHSLPPLRTPICNRAVPG
eukprot:6957605-Prymnesium_polylepis.1